ncbi:MAG: thioredoxin domain-containing protein, partial [Deltaproteobacteria bacterium]|nr:thioredoxin domain-containing protein [Deltaproteobacteria bacterium]
MENFACDMNKPMAINPLPFHVYLWTVAGLTVIGLADSIYLAISHYRVYTDIGYKSFCAISRALNCDTVSQSSYSIFLNLPLAVWGIIGYAFLLPFVIFAASKEAGKNRMWSLICWISLAFSCYSVFLALISTFVIKSYCIMCIISYGINLALLFYAWIIRSRFSNSGFIEDTRQDFLFLWHNRVKSIPILAVFSVTVVCIAMLFPAYWKIQPPPHSDEIATGITASGYPWIGAENAVLEITEFADYQCFQCKKMHFFLRQLMAANPGKIKIIHRHYP